jgi:hypothetical protein
MSHFSIFYAGFWVFNGYAECGELPDDPDPSYNVRVYIRIVKKFIVHAPPEKFN